MGLVYLKVNLISDFDFMHEVVFCWHSIKEVVE